MVVGGASVSPSEKSDWPKSLWRFTLTHDVIPSNDETFTVAVVFGESREEVKVCRCEERCWVGGRGPVFDSAHTAAKSSVLAGELDSCKELLQMEPDNKCEPFTLSSTSTHKICLKNSTSIKKYQCSHFSTLKA